MDASSGSPLCGQARAHAADLVDAFGIPDELVDVPLLKGGPEPRHC